MSKAVQKIFCIVGMFCMFAVAAQNNNQCHVFKKQFQDKAGDRWVTPLALVLRCCLPTPRPHVLYSHKF